jgi:hypothetical protein
MERWEEVGNGGVWARHCESLYGGGEEELNGGARPLKQDNKSSSQRNDCHVKDVQLSSR